MFCGCHSREIVGKLRNELVFPRAREVNHPPAALDVTADACTFFLTAVTRLNDTVTKQQTVTTQTKTKNNTMFTRGPFQKAGVVTK